MKNLSYDTEEVFDLETALRYLDEGYFVKHALWNDNFYFYKVDGQLYDHDDNEISVIKLENIKDRRFMLLCKEEDTTPELGELKSQSNEESSEIENEKVSIESDTLKPKKPLNEDENVKESITEKTKTTVIENEQSEEEETKKQITPIIENTISETNSNSYLVSSKTENDLTQQSDSLNFYKNLNAEKSSSIELLNNSTKQLMDLAKKSAKSDNPYSEVNAIKALSEVRSTLKTKLEFLKFGKDLVKEFEK